jgi:transposase InsO family protein
MPWKERDVMSLRREFAELASVEGANLTELCRRFGICRAAAYKWLDRWKSEGEAGLADRSKRPRTYRDPTPPEVEAKVLALRDRHPAWGGRKLRARLLAQGETCVPAASTITEILRRHGRIDPDESAKRVAPIRFERERPNDLWQMDFKGEFPLVGGGKCYPLTVLDDRSRFSLCVRACDGTKGSGVKEALTAVFRRYGLPRELLTDNGTPWAVSPDRSSHTRLSAWLMRLDVKPIRGRPYHPQTQGKEERFHRTLKAEVLRGRQFETHREVQTSFDAWREIYNHERPHEALGMQTPASRYEISRRSFPESLPPIEYGPGDVVRRTNSDGSISFRGRRRRIGEAFAGEPVALRPTGEDGVWEVYFCVHRVGRIDLREPEP